MAYLKKISKYFIINILYFIINTLCFIISVLIAGVDNGMVVVKPIKQTKIVSEKISTGSHLSCIREVLTLDKFATGGDENPLKIWDLETGKVEFTAKRVSFNLIFLFLLNMLNLFTYFEL